MSRIVEDYFSSINLSVFTTGDVAFICKVSPRTVSKWYDLGYLGGFKVPGALDRRITPTHLKKFIYDNGMEEVLEEDKFFRVGEISKICKVSITAIHHGIKKGI